jgi:hypothetical protein
MNLARLRLHFRAASPIFFAPGKAGNMLRGAFGSAFRSVACVPSCTDAKTCAIRADCPYARIFEPIALRSGPSGLSDHPRPFVFRASHLDGLTIDQFWFDIHLFQEGDSKYFVQAFERLAQQGLGPHRIPASLTKTDLCPFELTFKAPIEPVNHARVQFRTPTELKSGNQLAARPEFGILLARIRDRISTLSALYGDGPLNLEFDALGARAQKVQMIRCDLEQVHATRTSSRTGQTHALGGFIGEAEYQGDLAEFVPFLRAAQFTGVGRQTTWGKGEIRLTL